ncbi:MAG TPA: DUF4416 family protein [Nitrospirota bacterium]|nr:DUF4416 family protein [Nitrospirota bacterium]
MGIIRPVKQVKLFTAILFGSEDVFNTAREHLSSVLGPIDIASPVWTWSQSTFYEKEMGGDLKRIFLFFERPITPDQLADIKIFTNKIEEGFGRSSADLPERAINIDPGYITLAKVVLASTKDYAHRIYIGKGIYAEVTLFYQNKTFNPLPHTYPDYKSSEYVALFHMARGVFKGESQVNRHEP